MLIHWLNHVDLISGKKVYAIEPVNYHLRIASIILPCFMVTKTRGRCLQNLFKRLETLLKKQTTLKFFLKDKQHLNHTNVHFLSKWIDRGYSKPFEWACERKGCRLKRMNYKNYPQFFLKKITLKSMQWTP